MAEYIEREAALDLIGNKMKSMECFDEYADGQYSGLDTAFGMVEAVPAADVAPVVHGRWIPCEPDSDVRFYCSECGTEISTSWDYDCDEMWNGCPHCLARMDGE